jgi:hypothetical protein
VGKRPRKSAPVRSGVLSTSRVYAKNNKIINFLERCLERFAGGASLKLETCARHDSQDYERLVFELLRCEGTTNDKFECGGGGVEGDQYQINTA